MSNENREPFCGCKTSITWLVLAVRPSDALKRKKQLPRGNNKTPLDDTSLKFQSNAPTTVDVNQTLSTGRTVLTPDGNERPVLEVKKTNYQGDTTTKKPRVLFFHGEYTNEKIAEYVLTLTRWNKCFDFVIPGALHEGCICPPEMFDALGLDALKKNGKYSANEDFWKWGSRYEFIRDDPSDIPTDLKDDYQESIAEYIKQIDQDYGPFDGVMGFCEGGAALHCALGMKEDGKLNGVLDSVKFFIHLAPWATPLAGEYYNIKKSIPTLSVFGKNDYFDGFQEAFAKYPSGFKGYFDQHVHEGEHSYPLVSPDLLNKITNLLKTADEKHHQPRNTVEHAEECVIPDETVEEAFDTQVIGAIAESRMIDADSISKQTSLVDDLAMDSMHHLEMVQELECEFGVDIDISFEERLITKCETVQDVIDIMKEITLCY